MHRTATRAGAIFLLAATPLATSPQALAAEEDCPADSVCVWNLAGYAGQMASTDQPTDGCLPGISASAVNNSTRLNMLFWPNDSCAGEGEYVTVHPGERLPAIEPLARSIRVDPVPAPTCLVGNLLCR